MIPESQEQPMGHEPCQKLQWDQIQLNEMSSELAAANNFKSFEWTCDLEEKMLPLWKVTGRGRAAAGEQEADKYMVQYKKTLHKIIKYQNSQYKRDAHS